MSVSVFVTSENPLLLADALSVSSSRDKKNNAKGMACGVGPAVWRLIGIISVEFGLSNGSGVVNYQAGNSGSGGSGSSGGNGGSGMSSPTLAALDRTFFTMPSNFPNE